MGKPRGLRTARKHVKNRRAQVWADLDYKKANLGTRWKANPFGGASHAKGIVLEKVGYLQLKAYLIRCMIEFLWHLLVMSLSQSHAKRMSLIGCFI